MSERPVQEQDRPLLEEPSLPGLDVIGPWLLHYRHEMLALLLALAVHGAVLTVAMRSGWQRLPPQPTAAQRHELQVQITRDVPVRLGRPVIRIDSSALVVPMEAPKVHEAARPVPPAPPPVVNPEPSIAAITVMAPTGPAPLFDWWQYGSDALGYYGADEVDVASEPMAEDYFLLRLGAAAPKVEGRLVVRIYIGATGAVDRVEIRDATPRGMFEQILIQQLYGLQFAPAQKDGLFVKSYEDRVIHFSSEDTDNPPAADVPPGVPAAAGRTEVHH